MDDLEARLNALSSDAPVAISKKDKSKKMASKEPVETSAPTNYQALTNCQNVEGFWDLSALALIMSFLKTKVEIADTVTLTVVALHILKIKFEDDKDEWKLIAKKAQQWLKKQSSTSKVDVNTLQIK